MGKNAKFRNKMIFGKLGQRIPTDHTNSKLNVFYAKNSSLWS